MPRGPRIGSRAGGLALALGVALSALAAAPPVPAGATDPGAAQAPPAAAARRIVSLNPSLTAILVAIGARPQLVGVDDWSARSQPAVADLPTVGGLYTPSLEALMALRPDLVVLVPSEAQRGFRARLADLDVPVLALDPVSLDEVLETIGTLGAWSGHAGAAADRVDAIRAARRGVAAWAADRPRVAAVLVLQRDPLFAVGAGSFVDDMLRAAGGENLAAVFDEPYPRISREWLIDAEPHVLLDSANDPEPAAEYWARWPSLPAVRAGRVVSLPEGTATLPGPHLDRALRVLAEALHGEAPPLTPEGEAPPLAPEGEAPPAPADAAP